MIRSDCRQGLFCEAGNFFIDPWEPVERALVTHAHSDHAQPGLGELPLRRAGRARPAAPHSRTPGSRRCPYGESVTIGDTRVSFHPAGHILGSAQIRVEHRGEVWVVSGDYKRQPDPTCAAVRAGRLPHVHHRSDVRAADLHLGSAGRGRRTRSSRGGARTATRSGRRCSSATCSARRSGSSPEHRRPRPTARSTSTARWRR